MMQGLMKGSKRQPGHDGLRRPSVEEGRTLTPTLTPDGRPPTPLHRHAAIPCLGCLPCLTKLQPDHLAVVYPSIRVTPDSNLSKNLLLRVSLECLQFHFLSYLHRDLDLVLIALKRLPQATRFISKRGFSSKLTSPKPVVQTFRQPNNSVIFPLLYKNQFMPSDRPTT